MFSSPLSHFVSINGSYQFYTYYADFIDAMLNYNGRLCDYSDVPFYYRISENKCDCISDAKRRKTDHVNNAICFLNLFSLLKNSESNSLLYTLLHSNSIPSVTYNYNIENLPLKTREIFENKNNNNVLPSLYYYLTNHPLIYSQRCEYLSLNMIEYYLFSFLHFGSDNSSKSIFSSSSSSNKDIKIRSQYNLSVSSICNDIYSNLCLQYYNYFFENKRELKLNMNMTDTRNIDEKYRYSIELINGIIEFWLNKNNIYRYNKNSLYFDEKFTLCVYLYIIIIRITIVQIYTY